jgi:HAMP domain-containing protein
MIVICENCGQKYRIYPNRMPEPRMLLTCKSCSHSFKVEREEEKAFEFEENQTEAPPKIGQTEVPENKTQSFDELKLSQKSFLQRLKNPGLRIKMLLLFFLIPTILIVVASFLYLSQLNVLSSRLTGESLVMATDMTEDIVANRAQTVASQTRSFLLTHPHMKKAFFNYNMQFRQVALQKIGLTGYTSLYEIPKKGAKWRTWIHLNPNMVGVDIQSLKGVIGEDFNAFYKIITAVRNGKPSKGFYTGKDANGKIREHYIVCIPVEGTPFVIMAVSYPQEFTQAVTFMQKRAEDIAAGIRNIVLGILAVTVVLIGFVVSLYGIRVSRRIQYLTNVTSRISIGDLDMTIKAKEEGDEIEELASAFGRMQESIRLSIDRLRRR